MPVAVPHRSAVSGKTKISDNKNLKANVASTVMKNSTRLVSDIISEAIGRENKYRELYVLNLL